MGGGVVLFCWDIIIWFFFPFESLHRFQLKSSIVLALCVSLCSKIVPRCHPGYPPASSLELSGLTRLNIEAAIYCQSFFLLCRKNKTKQNEKKKKTAADFEMFPCEIMHGSLYEVIISSMFHFCFVVRWVDPCRCTGTRFLTLCFLSITWRPLKEAALSSSRKAFKKTLHIQFFVWDLLILNISR